MTRNPPACRYASRRPNSACRPSSYHHTADPRAQGIIAALALAVNVCVFAAIIKKAKATKTNPYMKEIWTGTKDFDEAMARAE